MIVHKVQEKVLEGQPYPHCTGEVPGGKFSFTHMHADTISCTAAKFGTVSHHGDGRFL